VAEFQYADFMSSGFDEITTALARYHYRSGVPIPVVLRAPSGGGVRASSFHSFNPEPWFAHTPGLKVICPAFPSDAKGLLKSAIRDDNPCVFLEHKWIYRRIKEPVSEDPDFLVPIGSAKIQREGSDVTIVTYGMMVHQALEAAEDLEQKGISAEVVDLRTITPLDKDTILSSVAKTSRALVLYESHRFLGVGAEVGAMIAEEGFEHLDAPVVRLAPPNVPVPFSPVLEDAYLPQVADIEAAVEKLAAWCPGGPTHDHRDHAPARRDRRRGNDPQVAEARGGDGRPRRAPARDLDRQGRHGGPVPGGRRAHQDPRPGGPHGGRQDPSCRGGGGGSGRSDGGGGRPLGRRAGRCGRRSRRHGRLGGRRRRRARVRAGPRARPDDPDPGRDIGPPAGWLAGSRAEVADPVPARPPARGGARGRPVASRRNGDRGPDHQERRARLRGRTSGGTARTPRTPRTPPGRRGPAACRDGAATGARAACRAGAAAGRSGAGRRGPARGGRSGLAHPKAHRRAHDEEPPGLRPSVERRRGRHGERRPPARAGEGGLPRPRGVQPDLPPVRRPGRVRRAARLPDGERRDARRGDCDQTLREPRDRRLLRGGPHRPEREGRRLDEPGGARACD